MKRKDWSVVVAGKWNRAIFTPAWVSKELFNFSDDSQTIRVMVALDELAPYQISDGSVTVVAQSERLILKTESSTFENLEKAKVIAARAIQELPVTPFVAAGMNCRFSFEEGEGNLPALTSSSLDHLLPEIEGVDGCTTRLTKRSVDWRLGQINIGIEQDAADKFSIEINVHQSSTDKEVLLRWLNTPIKDIQEVVSKIFDHYFGIPLPESFNATG